MLNQLTQSNNNQTIEKEGNLEITKEIVQFAGSVYQLKNVTGFGIGKVKRKGIPILFILMSSVFGLLLQSPFTPDSLKLLGNLGLLISIAAIGYNIYILVIAPPLHGLSLYLNSGDERIFITENKQLLKRVIMTLREFMENPEKFNYINIEVGQDMKGNIVIGDVSGNVDYK